VKTELVFGKVKKIDNNYHAWVEMNTNGCRYVLDVVVGVIIANPRHSYFDESYLFQDKLKAFKERANTNSDKPKEAGNADHGSTGVAGAADCENGKS